MKISIKELRKAVDFLEKKSGDTLVRIDIMGSEVFELVASDLESNLITIQLFDTEKNNSYPKLTSTRSL